MKNIFFLFFLTLSFTGCTSRMLDFTVISTKNIPLSSTDNQLKIANERVTGTDKKHMIWIFPLGVPSLKEAIDKAIQKYPGAVGLSDGVIYSSFWTCIFYGQNKYKVTGTPVYPIQNKEISNNFNP